MAMKLTQFRLDVNVNHVRVNSASKANKEEGNWLIDAGHIFVGWTGLITLNRPHTFCNLPLD